LPRNHRVILHHERIRAQLRPEHLREIGGSRNGLKQRQPASDGRHRRIVPARLGARLFTRHAFAVARKYRRCGRQIHIETFSRRGAPATKRRQLLVFA
jgi:hypothetical protein